MTKHKSGAEKRKKRKRENKLIEAQRGALNRYFPAASCVDVNENIQSQESENGRGALSMDSLKFGSYLR